MPVVQTQLRLTIAHDEDPNIPVRLLQHFDAGALFLELHKIPSLAGRIYAVSVGTGVPKTSAAPALSLENKAQVTGAG